MKIAVLMSTYNGEKYLEKQLDSILNQKGKFEIEILVRDDGSTDSTKKILKTYEKKKSLKWYSEKNIGPGLSFFDLIHKAGEYDLYAFSDQDDLWNANKLDRAVSKIGENTKPKLYFSNAELVDSNLRYLGRSVYKNIPKLDFFTLSCAGGALGCTMVFNNELAQIIRKCDMPSKMVMHDFYLAVVCKGIGGDIIYDDYPSMKYRQHDSNVVGVAHGKIGTIKNRVKDIFTKEKISIEEQSRDILNSYFFNLCENNRRDLEEISHYRNSIMTRYRLATNRRLKFINWNMSIKIRMSILLGNR